MVVKVILPDASLRSPTAVPGKADLRTKVYSFKLEPTHYRWNRPSEGTELAVKRIGLRAHDDDRDGELAVGVNGVWQKFNVGLLHDAYDGRGVFGKVSGAVAQTQENVVGQFGEALARINELLCKIDGRPAPTDYPSREVVLGEAMLGLTAALEKLKRPVAAGFPFEIPLLVSRQDWFTVECGYLKHPLQVHILAAEKMDVR